jgi:hypothetical protein
MFISLFAFMPFRVQRNEPAAKRRRKGSRSFGPPVAELSAYKTADD